MSASEVKIMKIDAKAAVITVSDKGSRGERVDTAGPRLVELLLTLGIRTEMAKIVPDDTSWIRQAILEACDERHLDLLFTAGGTGLSERDVTPEATRSLLDMEVPGITEAIRTVTYRITPRAMLSRAVSGVRGKTLVINMPGSKKAVEESFEVIKEALLHAVEVLRGRQGDCGRG
jgi:molybdopterin adenylyltransferase